MEIMRKKELKINLSYESGRLAEGYIADAYEKLMPMIKHPMNSSKNGSEPKETKKELLNDSSRVICKSIIRETGTS